MDNYSDARDRDTNQSDCVKSEAITLLYQLYIATISDTGFVQAVRNVSGTPYPWPSIDAIQEKIEDFLKTQGVLSTTNISS